MNYKNTFDFIYKTLGYSPGGSYMNGVYTFNKNKISKEDLSKLVKAKLEASTEIQNLEFNIDDGPTEEEKLLAEGYSKSIVGDTTFWSPSDG